MGDLKSTLEMVNTFYSNAYSQMITYTIGLLAFLGAFVPSIISFIQSRSLKRENGRLIEELNKKNIESETKLKQIIENLFDSKVKELKDQFELKNTEMKNAIEKVSATANGKSFHIQAQQMFDKKNYYAAFISSLYSIKAYCRSEDEMNMQRIAKTLISSLKELNETSFVNGIEEDDEQIKDTVAELQAINYNDRYSDLIKEINKEYASAKKRKNKE